MAASNTATDDVANYVTHRAFNTNIQYFCAHFVFKKLTTDLASQSHKRF